MPKNTGKNSRGQGKHKKFFLSVSQPGINRNPVGMVLVNPI